MPSGGKPHARAPSTGVDKNLDDLAMQALSVVAARGHKPKTGAIEALVNRLLDAVSGRSDETYRAVARRMLAMGISPETIVDQYIPAVARRMGDEWCNDTSSFATVTIGSSRLQALLRELGTYWSADAERKSEVETSSALVIVPQHSNHTLGAAVLSSQLRRSGLSVRLCIGMDPRALSVVLQNGTFEAVIISATLGDRLDKVGTLVDIAKGASRGNARRVIVGGAVLDQNVNVAAATGADLITRELSEVIEFCGFSV